QLVAGTYGGTYGHWLRRPADAVVRHPVLGRAARRHRPVRGRQRSEIPGRGGVGGEAAGDCRLV
nr:hypothetical protein [Tanacetum cinerariifolium]